MTKCSPNGWASRAARTAKDEPVARVSDVPAENVSEDVRDVYLRFASAYGPFRMCGFFNRFNDALMIDDEADTARP